MRWLFLHKPCVLVVKVVAIKKASAALGLGRRLGLFVSSSAVQLLFLSETTAALITRMDPWLRRAM